MLAGFDDVVVNQVVNTLHIGDGVDVIRRAGLVRKGDGLRSDFTILLLFRHRVLALRHGVCAVVSAEFHCIDHFLACDPVRAQHHIPMQVIVVFSGAGTTG